MSAVMKRFYFARRNPKSPAASFPTVWRAHSDLLQTMPALARRFARYAYCLSEDVSDGLGVTTRFDGVGIFWMASEAGHPDNAERLRRFARVDPSGSQRMRADELRVFAEPVAGAAGAAIEQCVRSGPLGNACLYVVFRDGAEGPTVDRQLASEQIAKAVAAVPIAEEICGRIAVNQVIEGTLPAAVIAEFWFESAASARASIGRGDLGQMLLDQWSRLSPAGTVMSTLTSICHRVDAPDADEQQHG